MKNVKTKVEEKIKYWVSYCEEYPGGMVCRTRRDALESSAECRENECKAYVRVKFYTQKEFDELPELD